MTKESKKLYRSRDDKVIAGVCGGLGEYFNIDPILIRIGFILLFLSAGIGLLLYILLAIILPKEPIDSERVEEPKEKEIGKLEYCPLDKRTIFGLFITFIGFLLLLEEFFPGEWINWSILWAIALIFLGFIIAFRKEKSSCL